MHLAAIQPMDTGTVTDTMLTDMVMDTATDILLHMVTGGAMAMQLMGMQHTGMATDMLLTEARRSRLCSLFS